MVAGASELCAGWSPGSVLTSAIDLAMTLCGHPEPSHSLGVLNLKREAYSNSTSSGVPLGGWVGGIISNFWNM